MCKAHLCTKLVCALSTVLLLACNPEQLSRVSRVPAEKVAFAPAEPSVQSIESLQLAQPTQSDQATSLDTISPKLTTEAQVRLQGNDLMIDLHLPPRAQAFGVQALDLSDAAKIVATTTSSRGHVYQPNGAVSGEVNYPANGVISLTFNNVVPDEVLLVELQVKNTTANIVQADLALALRHNGINNLTSTMNFQTTAVGKTMKALVASNASRAGPAGLLSALNTLMLSITGRSGTSPNFSYTTHPSLVRTALLATALETQDPGDLTAADYRGVGGTVNLTIAGLVGSDKLNVQVTDAATAIKNNLGNGLTAYANATPGNGLKLKHSPVAGNILTYTYVSTPATFNYVENGTRAVTLTATPIVSVSSFSPTSGAPGTVVTINGSGFTGATAVRFNGSNASFTVNSNTQITATVPVNCNDGVITVVNGASADSANSFNVFARLHVKADASGANNGQGWANAYTELRTAVTASRNGDEIWVAAGTYKPHASNVEVSMALKDNVDLYGGFAGNETSLAARNPALNLTVISGDLQNDDNTSTVPFSSATGNSKKLFQGAKNVIFEGFTLRAAHDTALNLEAGDSMQLNQLNFVQNHSLEDGGAGLRCVESNFSLKNSSFSQNTATAGGGMATFSCHNTLVEALRFENNRVTAHFGGGWHMSDNDGMVASDLQFEGNSAANEAGGMYIEASENVTLTNVSFKNNQAPVTGGLFITIQSRQIHMENMVFENNQANIRASALAIGGGSGNITLKKALFKGNQSPLVAGIAAVNVSDVSQSITLEQIALIGNTNWTNLLFNLYNAAQSPIQLELKNLLVANNTNYEHNIWFYGEPPYPSFALRNITFANNTCTNAAANRCSVLNQLLGMSTYQNLLFWKDQMGTAPPTVGGNIDLGTGGTPFANFNDPDGANNQFFDSDDGFRLNASATAAINAGINNAQIPSTDIRGQSRVGTPEPGAYEYP